MPDIRYVCLSDMHLGADCSVLTTIQPDLSTTDPSKASPLMVQLVTSLRELIGRNEGTQKPTLILNGDALEMALTDTNKAAMVFERFIELAFPPDGEPLFEKDIFYLPGNHDHHIWESARETQYVNYLCGVPPGTTLNSPWHTTKMFPAPTDLVTEFFLTSLLRRYPHLNDASIHVLYPNYALLSDDGRRCVIFSHGHYVESIYSLMTTLNTMFFPNRLRPGDVWDIESENFAWIDFFWSTMGRSGDVGQDIGIFYDKMQNHQQFEMLLRTFLTSLVEKTRQPGWLEGAEAKALGALLDALLDTRLALERNKPSAALSQDSQQGLQFYVESPLLKQLQREKDTLPSDISFLFGHTHKPFQQEMSFNGYAAPLHVYNSGGWIVDTVEPAPIYGAAPLLIDEQLEVVSLRLYNHLASPHEYAVRVQQSVSSGAAPGPFYERICQLVQATDATWKTFSQLAAQEVFIRAQVLQKKMNS